MCKIRNPVTHLIFTATLQGLRCRVKSVLENFEQDTQVSGEIQQNEMGGETSRDRHGRELPASPSGGRD